MKRKNFILLFKSSSSQIFCLVPKFLQIFQSKHRNKEYHKKLKFQYVKN